VPVHRIVAGRARCHRLTVLARAEPSAPPHELGPHVHVRARRTDAAREPARASATAPSRGARAGARALHAGRADAGGSGGIPTPSSSPSRTSEGARVAPSLTYRRAARDGSASGYGQARIRTQQGHAQATDRRTRAGCA
jgi:hypothetical protein